jgi:hypothetical protein
VYKKGFNTISPNESENVVNKEYNNYVLVVEEEVLGNFLVKSFEEVNIVLEESYNINPLKLLESPPTLLDVQHVISLDQHVKLSNPSPLTCNEKDEKDEYIPNLLGYVQVIFTKALNSVCSNSHPQSYSVYRYKPRKLVDFLFMSCHAKMFDSAKSFACRIPNLHVEIIEQI